MPAEDESKLTNHNCYLNSDHQETRRPTATVDDVKPVGASAKGALGGYYKASAQLIASRAEVMNLPHFGFGLAETIIIRMPHSFLCVALTTPCCLFCQGAP